VVGNDGLDLFTSPIHIRYLRRNEWGACWSASLQQRGERLPAVKVFDEDAAMAANTMKFGVAVVESHGRIRAAVASVRGVESI
jgi:hypothetical protein